MAAFYRGLPINGIDVAEFEQAGGYFLIAREADCAVDCGAVRPLGEQCAEIQRMFVRERPRRCGIETGCDNSEAIALYEAEGYFPMPAFSRLCRKSHQPLLCQRSLMTTQDFGGQAPGLKRCEVGRAY
ncbi:MAG TPA: hypothetical protein VFA77_11780 [Candidatus Eisenbacteria bacterium]|nr:hypothetical protein [Candidatus Eisenbacteria bacterium]